MSAVAQETAAPGRAGDRPRVRWRRWPLPRVVAVVAVVAVVVGVVAVIDPFGGGGTSSVDNGAATALATVAQRDLSSQTQVDGTLGYVGSYSVLSQAQGTITALPAVGQTLTQGQPLYWVNAKPVVLLYGSTPAYRALSQGMTGPDVTQLNADLVALGDAAGLGLSPTSDTFSAATATALERLQARLGVDQTGRLAAGDAVFEPTALRITAVNGSVGASASGSVLTASSTTRGVTIKLSALQQSQVSVGDHVTITLPDRRTTGGVVYTVGTVATTPQSGGTATVDVLVIPTDPAATGSLDQAPVQVAITTATARQALAVPVSALLALSGGGYGVETVDARGVHHVVPVTLGLFDDADGLVQVTGPGLAGGDRVVVPSA